MEIILSPLGEESLNEVIEYLRIHWTDKEIIAFRKDIDDFKNTLETGIIKPIKVKSTKNFYAFLLRSKLITVYYEIVNEHYIKILLFWSNKKDPKKLQKLLKQL